MPPGLKRYYDGWRQDFQQSHDKVLLTNIMVSLHAGVDVYHHLTIYWIREHGKQMKKKCSMGWADISGIAESLSLSLSQIFLFLMHNNPSLSSLSLSLSLSLHLKCKTWIYNKMDIVSYYSPLSLSLSVSLIPSLSINILNVKHEITTNVHH